LARRGLDPFSYAAQFPSLAAQDDAKYKSFQTDMTRATQQHTMALAAGTAGSSQNDPMQYGSSFAQKYPGAYDMYKEGMRRRDTAEAIQQREQGITMQGMNRHDSTVRNEEPNAANNFQAGLGYRGPGPSTVIPSVDRAAADLEGRDQPTALSLGAPPALPSMDLGAAPPIDNGAPVVPLGPLGTHSLTAPTFGNVNNTTPSFGNASGANSTTADWAVPRRAPAQYDPNNPVNYSGY
jgi:hypothetical protein